jgi:hypothetical protein
MWGAACDAEPGPGPATTPPTRAPTSPAGPDQAWALWPEDTREATNAALPDREGEEAEQLVRRFAGEVLGWGSAEIEAYDGPIQCREDGCLAVHREPGGPGVLVQLVAVSESAFSVFSVGSLEGDDAPLGLGVQGDEVSVAFSLDDAAGADFAIGFGNCARSLGYTEDANETFSLGCTPASSGYFLVLFKDAEGHVSRALGSALPEGDFAAG